CWQIYQKKQITYSLRTPSGSSRTKNTHQKRRTIFKSHNKKKNNKKPCQPGKNNPKKIPPKTKKP
ncbi:hypothetical protein ACQWHS_24495, partial [Salmonella enterica subsp. enterica serovar Infantis]